MKKIVFITLLIVALAAVAQAVTTKTALFAAQTGVIAAGATYGADTNSFEITDPTLFKCVKIEGLGHDDHIRLMRQNYAADGWEYVTDGTGIVQLNRHLTSVCPVEPGTYALDGEITSDAATAYTEE